MPKEFRKRGKKNKKKPEEHLNPDRNSNSVPNPPDIIRVEPTWIIPTVDTFQPEDANPEAPFGYVDVDVKAYFRTVDVQIRDWQETTAGGQEREQDIDPNEGVAESKYSLYRSNTSLPFAV